MTPGRRHFSRESLLILQNPPKGTETAHQNRLRSLTAVFRKHGKVIEIHLSGRVKLRAIIVITEKCFHSNNSPFTCEALRPLIGRKEREEVELQDE